MSEYGKGALRCSDGHTKHRSLCIWGLLFAAVSWLFKNPSSGWGEGLKPNEYSHKSFELARIFDPAGLRTSHFGRKFASLSRYWPKDAFSCVLLLQ